ncbi:MAG: replicative DNA helicase [Candidatus Izemoplasmatales bacterium]|jgi:replicative DNA helicase|nr:replicative DNA helicase [bacterium]MDZ4197009.1 replicative DNA helicase [Candidatus Izemoplasmatales bacterium]
MEQKIPQNIEAEQAVLGSVFFDQGSIKTVLDKLHQQDFYHPQHQIIYESMKELFQELVMIDYTTLSDRLSSKGMLERAGGMEYITALIEAVPSSSNLINYINIVKDKSITRKIQDTCRKIIEESYNVEFAPDFIDDVERQIVQITKEKRTSDFKEIGGIAEELLKKIANQAQVKGHITGIDSGYAMLNHYTLGLQPSDLLIIAARPSVGKTAFALNVALNAAKSDKKPHIAFFSLEMGVDQLVMRMLGCQAQVDNFNLRKGDLMSQDWEKLHYAVSLLQTLNIYFDDSGTVKVTDLRSKCRKLRQDGKLDLVIIDYLQLLSGSATNQQNRVQEVSEISRVLKEMARELKIPVVALSQLSRNVETRQDKTPVMADLRESGSIEQDADIILFLYRKEPTEGDKTISNHIMVNIAKNRSGTIGEFELLFNKNMSTFSNTRVSNDRNDDEEQYEVKR